MLRQKNKADLADFLFIFCATLSVSLLIISNIAATKLWDFFGVAMLDGGMISFPIAFVLSDVILEIWGKKKAKFIVWTGFLMNLLAALIFYIVQVLPAGSGWENQGAYEAILGFMPRVVLASLSSYLVAQLLNVFVFVKIKEKTGEKWLWMRSLGSSLLANIVNSLIFCGIAFGGVVSIGEWWAMVLTSCGIMIVLEVVLTPLNYAVVKTMRGLLRG